MVWRRPTATAVSSLLRNPAYAGTFVYGRTRFVPRVPGGPPRKPPLPPEQWRLMVPDKYPAYIDRETSATIQAILRDHYQEYDRRRSRGVARSGSAPLQGPVYCGHCGRKMTVQYQAAARYLCCGHKEQGGGRECQRIPIAPVDARVVQSFWEALAPAELDRYDTAVAALDEQRRQTRRARDLQLERLRYAARLAEKQYQLVTPENRLVASELERPWGPALQAVRQAEEESRVEEAEIEPVTEDLRRQLDEIRPTLQQMWDEGSLSNVRKKELLRTVIDKVVLQRPIGDRCEIRIVWNRGDWTTIALDPPVVTYAEMGDGQELIAEVVRRARAGQTDRQIAAELTAAGYHAPLKKGLNAAPVNRIGVQHSVLTRRTELLRAGAAGWLSRGQAVSRLGEHHAWAYHLIREGRLVIRRDRETGLYLIADNPKSLKQSKELLRGRRFSLAVEPRSS